MRVFTSDKDGQNFEMYVRAYQYTIHRTGSLVIDYRGMEPEPVNVLLSSIDSIVSTDIILSKNSKDLTRGFIVTLKDGKDFVAMEINIRQLNNVCLKS